MLRQFYTGKRVFVTGHTGFKGAWLSLWLKKFGAKVAGYSLPPPTNPDLYSIVRSQAVDRDITADIRDIERLRDSIKSFDPEIIFHMAAQPLVRRSYSDAAETFVVNSVGTMNVLEAVRSLRSPANVVLITTDKCYDNKEWDFSYRENDPLGGSDPYSASKAAAEILIQSWRRSFFRKDSGLGGVASARAGNVIGGGDYAEDRLVPDVIRALLNKETLRLRNPGATRPWQHVLDCLHGYLVLAKGLHENGPESEFASAFNFGPGPEGNYSVGRLVDEIGRFLPIRWESPDQSAQPHEAGKLNLAIDKAAAVLNWAPVWGFPQAVEETARWYDQRHFKNNPDMLAFSLSQIERFESDATADR